MLSVRESLGAAAAFALSACGGSASESALPLTESALSSSPVLVSSPAVPVPTAGYPWKVWTADAVVVAPSSSGTTYYVDASAGKDTNDGKSLALAFASVKKAVASVAAGDTVLIRAGLYREGINLGNAPSGTAAKPITFGSYGNGEVILDGSTKVSVWTQVSGTVWQAPVTFTPIAVVINDVPLKQTPDGQTAVTAGSGKWYYNAGGKTIVADVGNGNPNQADIVVPGNDGGQQHVFFFGDWYNFKGLTIRGSGSNGIWGYGSHVTVESCNIKFNGKSAVSFMVNSGGTGNTDNSVLYSHIYQNTMLNWPRGNNGFADSGGGWSGGIAWETNLRPVARGNIVHMNGGEGVISYGTQAGKPSGSALFEQNVVYDNWSVNMYFDNQPNDVARNNIIFNHPADTSTWFKPPSSGYPWTELYKYSVCLMLADEENSSDSTGNYANLSGTQVYNNLLAGCRMGIRDYSEGNAHTIKYHGLKNTLIANNTIILPASPPPNTDTIGIFLQDNTTPSGVNRNVNSVIQNNVIYGFGNVPLIWSELAGPLLGIAIDYNNYYGVTSTSSFRVGSNSVASIGLVAWQSQLSGAETHSTFQDPKLVGIAQFNVGGITPYDYKNADLSATSPLRGAGTAQSTISTNLIGASRAGNWNLGAF